MVLAGKHAFIFMNLLAYFILLFPFFMTNVTSCISVSLSTLTF